MHGGQGTACWSWFFLSLSCGVCLVHLAVLSPPGPLAHQLPDDPPVSACPRCGTPGVTGSVAFWNYRCAPLLQASFHTDSGDGTCAVRLKASSSLHGGRNRIGWKQRLTLPLSLEGHNNGFLSLRLLLVNKGLNTCTWNCDLFCKCS